MADSEAYMIKRIDFFGRQAPIFLQNLNGPCPLLAIANVLSLRNQLTAPAGAPDIAQSKLVTMVAERLLESSRSFEHAPEVAAHYQQNLSDSLSVLSKLATGIDVNLKFHDVHAFEPTPEVAVFDLLGIHLLHGWLVDPRDARTAAAFANKSYNELVEMLFDALGDEEAVRLCSSASLPRRSASSVSCAGGRAASVSGGASFSGAEGAGARSARSSTAGGLSPVPFALPSGGIAEGGAAVNTAAAMSTPPVQQRQPQPLQVVRKTSTGEPQTEGEAIEDVLDDMILSISEQQRPGAIQLGESPTRSSSINRAAYYRGAAPSPLASAASGSGKGEGAAAAAGIGAAPTPADAAQTPAEAAPATPAPAQPPPQQPPQDVQAVRRFLETHCSQLTEHGLRQLAEGLRDHQLAVFFRNNHFSTIFKRNQAIYLLMTDMGYAHEPDIVWERLDDVHGNTAFCTAAFERFVPHREATTAAGTGGAPSYSQVAAVAGGGAAAGGVGAGGGGAGPGFGQHPAAVVGGDGNQGGATPMPHSADADFALALQLQLQEEEAMAQQEQRARAREAAAASGQQQQQQVQTGGGQWPPPQHPQQQQQQQQEQAQYDGRRHGGGRHHPRHRHQEQRQQQGQQHRPQRSGGGHQGLEQLAQDAKEKCTVM